MSVVEHGLQLNEYKTQEDVSKLPTNSGLPTEHAPDYLSKLQQSRGSIIAFSLGAWWHNS